MGEKEKDTVSTEENKPPSVSSILGPPEPGTPERALAERKLVRKLDARVLPTIFILYIMNYIDRNGIAAARLKGLQEDLHLSDVQYATVLAILFASYSPAQIPSNMLLNYVSRPSLYIGSCVTFWGLMSALTGVTTNAGGIYACRIFVGLPEAAFVPGVVYLLSRWYTKKELAFRVACLYAGLLISNAFGALMAAGILANMENKRGVRAWRWLFFIEGAITIVVGLLSMWLLPDYPNNTRWMSPEERRLAQARVSEDAGEADQDNAEDSPWRGFKMALKDPFVPAFALLHCLQILGLSYTIFFPTLTETLGFPTTVSLLLAAPPWILSTVICCVNAWHADKTGERFFHMVAWWWSVIFGCIVGLSTMKIPARYVAMFLLACGHAGESMLLVWLSNVVPRPPAKRAAAMGIVNGVGNLGNLIGSYVWKAKWGPEYHPSLGITIGAFTLGTSLALGIRQTLILKNKKLDEDENAALKEADRTRVEEAARLEGMTFEQAMERRKGYRYLY